MQLLTDDEAAGWSSRFVTVGGTPRTIRITAPVAATEIAGLAYRLVITCAPDYAEERFTGALVWLRRWEIWSESVDNQGYALLNGLRLNANQKGTLDVAPAMEFGSGEFFDATACLLISLVFQWDTEFLSADGTFRCSLSHHGDIELRVSDPERGAEVFQRFGKYSPLEVSST